ncbi:hypothetical protein Cni_G07439 [Canna indica]|uniref:Uncharacterized protein n=1 Tax=Canna indica TaxID=4628 RepID=A0AAQ3JYZ4_9LILI|nr:hypothetical protein Cni_G07439 [Canna indica]
MDESRSLATSPSKKEPLYLKPKKTPDRLEESVQNSKGEERSLRNDTSKEGSFKSRDLNTEGVASTWASLFRRSDPDSNWRDSKEISEKINKIQNGAKGRIGIEESDLVEARMGSELILYEVNKEIDSIIDMMGERNVTQMGKKKLELQTKEMIIDMDTYPIKWRDITDEMRDEIIKRMEFKAKKEERSKEDKHVEVEEINELDKLAEKLSASFQKILENKNAKEDFLEEGYCPETEREKKKENLKNRRWSGNSGKLFNIPMEYKGNKIKKRRVSKECGALKGDEDPSEVENRVVNITE